MAPRCLPARVILVIMEEFDSPMSARHNAVKLLRNVLQGMWSYRISDYRVIYHPNKDARITHSPGVMSTADVYE